MLHHLFTYVLQFFLVVTVAIPTQLLAQEKNPLTLAQFLEKVYALNCSKAPHDIIYFIQTQKYGVVSLYPEKTRSSNTLSITGSSWGIPTQQVGPVTLFSKNGKTDNRAVWTQNQKLALVLGNGQFRENQKFYDLCAANSAAYQYAKKDRVLELAFERFSQFEDKMTEQKKNSDCYIFNAARQSCAAAGSYERCMSIRWGEDWSKKEASCK